MVDVRFGGGGVAQMVDVRFGGGGGPLPRKRKGEFVKLLGSNVNWAGENHQHLHEATKWAKLCWGADFVHTPGRGNCTPNNPRDDCQQVGVLHSGKHAG